MIPLINILNEIAYGSQPVENFFPDLLTYELEFCGDFLAYQQKFLTKELLIEERIQAFKLITQSLKIDPIFSPERFLITLWRLWLPLSLYLISKRRELNRPFIQGILGGQGTGKTTLAKILKLIMADFGYSLISLSLDDLYKTYEERQTLQKLDPRLIWRGPPGTHDIELGIQILDHLKNSDPVTTIALPRFDKSAYNGMGERTTSEIISTVDIVLFEGWFVGVKPIDPCQFCSAPHPILNETDREFARDINEKLRDYLPLWERLDQLMIFYPIDYRLSLQWRLDAEREMKARGKSGMSDEEICQFVEYFWKSLHPQLFIDPLLKNRDKINLIVSIYPDHSIGSLMMDS